MIKLRKFMDMAEKDYPDNLVGESLLPCCQEKKGQHRDWVLAEYHGDRCNTGTFMLRKENWKYIKYIGYRPQLFNLKKDPWEVNNQASNEPQIVDEMDELLSEIIDYKEIDARAKAYDRENFKKWRQEQKEKGTYNDKMAFIYSGFWGTNLNNLKKWCSEDEAKIKEWLENEN